jgi:ABC-2 type transport system permease protein
MTRRQRLVALLRKEWLDLRRNPGALVPVALVSAMALILPFFIVFGIPAWTGEPLRADRDLAQVSRMIRIPPGLADNGRVQYFLLQQFLLLFLLTPITGAMALAAHSVVGEKQARTLEPLLATPTTTVELLLGKVIGALWPSLAMTVTCLAIFFAGIARFADSGVATAMLDARAAVLLLVVAPAASLVALQAAILVSSRVNDARTAQQVGVLIIVPLTGLLVAQFAGLFWLTNSVMLLVGLGLFAVWLALLALSVVLFQREAILTRWR